MPKRVWTLVCLLAVMSLPAWGQYSFSTLDDPSATGTQFLGIVPRGVICGAYLDSSGNHHATLVVHGAFQDITLPPGAFDGSAIGMNARGDLVGVYTDGSGQHGWIQLKGQPIRTLDPPGNVTGTLARSINNGGDVAGAYGDASGNLHGYIYSNGVFNDVNIPGATTTDAWDIDDAGDSVGGYTDASGAEHGYLIRGGMVTTIDYPSANNFTIAARVTDGGSVLGFYIGNDGGSGYGFLLSSTGTFTAIDFPGAVATRPRGVNPRGEIAGWYRDSSGVFHGFVASPAK